MRRAIGVAAVVVCALPPAAVVAEAPAHERQNRVLVVHAARREAPMPMVVDQTLQRVLGERLGGALDYYGEYLDSARFGEASYLDTLRAYLASKYTEHGLDLLIATTDAATAFVEDRSGALFPGLPLIHTTTTGLPPTVPVADAAPHRRRSTGVTVTLDLARTLALALRLQPGTKRVFVVSGTSPWDRFYEGVAREQLRRFEGPVEITFWSGRPMPELLESVSALPPASILYPLVVTEDSTGARFLPFPTHDRILAAANAPAYTWVTLATGRGSVGGSLASPEILARGLAELGLRVLGGEAPESIPVEPIDVYVDELDWRQLERWGIDESRVPEGTAILFREPGAWERYRHWILGAALVLSLQTALIVGLVIQRARRRRVETALRASHVENQDLAGRLIGAQEEERARIARELHDDVSQQLAGLSIVLSTLKQRLRSGAPKDSGLAADYDATIATLQGRAVAAADAVRAVSHGLHSGALEHGGLVVALQEHCDRVGSDHGLEVAFAASGAIEPLDPAVALCLFRVAQEALGNTARHARARAARVRLARTGDTIELDVGDDGAGFDPARRNGRGLGLRSIRERVRLVGGQVEVESTPGRGTTLRVRVPAASAGGAQPVSWS